MPKAYYNDNGIWKPLPSMDFIEGEGEQKFVEGEFTPTEDVLQYDFTIGFVPIKFMLYPLSAVGGRGVKAGGTIMFDRPNRFFGLTSTNNTGTGWQTVENKIDNGTWITTSPGYIYFIMNNTRFTIWDDGTCRISTSVASGTCYGYFIGGVKYKWVAER